METTYHNLQDAAEAVLRGKFIVINVYIKKKNRLQISNLTLHLKELEKEEQTKPEFIRTKETTKIRAEIYKIAMRKIIEKIIKTKSSVFFEKIKLKNLNWAS